MALSGLAARIAEPVALDQHRGGDSGSSFFFKTPALAHGRIHQWPLNGRGAPQRSAPSLAQICNTEISSLTRHFPSALPSVFYPRDFHSPCIPSALCRTSVCGGRQMWQTALPVPPLETVPLPRAAVTLLSPAESGQTRRAGEGGAHNAAATRWPCAAAPVA